METPDKVEEPASIDPGMAIYNSSMEMPLKTDQFVINRNK
tara:strand:- start:641 stop:760 length:120 start_codon:yes stop_codon:yes gene_type:complete